jgi:zinc/manganese transport system substrate-binding protein
MRRTLPAVALCVALLLGAGCATSGTRTDDLQGDRKLQVVAAENVWGSIAAQLGGTRVDVTSIVANPATDPHSYEATAADARAIADADLVIVNGLGYDAWAGKAVGANPSPIRAVIDVGDLTGHHAGDNPHRWYYPADVDRVATAISHDYQRLDPRHASYYAHRLVDFRSSSLAAYHHTLADLRRRYAGTPVGASESIFEGLARAVGLRLVTPTRFLDAVSEGSDVTAADKATVDRQLSRHQVAVFAVNSQNSTPDVQRLVAKARADHIPVVPLTETLSPAGATFQQWQVAQLRALGQALHEATGR